jgi:hypothetical protein
MNRATGMEITALPQSVKTPCVEDERDEQCLPLKGMVPQAY